MKHWGRWLLFEQLVFFPKHVTLPEKMRLAWLVSIPLALLTSSEVPLCAHRADMSLDMLEKCHQPMFRLRISELRLEDLQTVTFYFWTLQEDHTPDNVTFTYLLEPFSSLLHVWLRRQNTWQQALLWLVACDALRVSTCDAQLASYMQRMPSFRGPASRPLEWASDQKVNFCSLNFAWSTCAHVRQAEHSQQESWKLCEEWYQYRFK